MEFARIINAAGLRPKDFPKASTLPVDAYDDEDNKLDHMAFSFSLPLFENSPRSLEKFRDLCQRLEGEVGSGKDLRLSIKMTDIVFTIYTPKSNIQFVPLLLFR